MKTVNETDFIKNFDDIADNIIKSDEPVLISRPENKNLVIITETEYRKFENFKEDVKVLNSAIRTAWANQNEE